jgi:Sulfotransferase domain
MSNSFKTKVVSILKTYPLLEDIARNTLWKKPSLEKRFSTELELIHGTHTNTSEHPSLIHFSFNKAATQYIKSILQRCAIEQGLIPVRFNEYAFDSDFPYLDWLSLEEIQEYKHLFRSKGYLYSAFGGMIEGIEDLQSYKVILFSRDPRDILVSQYYSIAYSHRMPDEFSDKRSHFLSRREAAVQGNINDYAVANSDRILNIFARYQDLLLSQYSNVYVTQYEQMIVDFEDWLGKLLIYCDLNVSKKLLKKIIEENNAKKPKVENKYTHNRKGKSGDYKGKLSPETIVYLNNKFSTILKEFSYSD